MPPAARQPSARSWIFVSNNWATHMPQYADPESLKEAWPADKVAYALWQHEQGASGTHHLQGFAIFKRAMTRGQVAKILPHTMWAPRLPTSTDEAAIAYASKEDETYRAGPWEFGAMPVSQQGRRTDLEGAVALIASEGLPAMIKQMPCMYVKYERGLRALELTMLSKRSWFMDVRVYWGAAGTGKTRAVFDEFGADNVYVKDPTNEWWDGYTGERCVLMDEFYGTLKFSYLQRLLDRYPMPIQVKGGTTQFRSKVIVLTSNISWERWYAAKFEDDPEIKRSFARRLTTVREFSRVKV